METLRIMLDTEWKSFWTSAGNPYPLEYHSVATTTPKDGLYCRLTLIPGRTAPAAVGPVHERTPAMLVLQVFLPEGEPFQKVTALHKLVADHWRYKQLSNTTGGVRTFVDCENVSLSPATAEKGFQQWNVWINFRCDTHNPP